MLPEPGSHVDMMPRCRDGLRVAVVPPDGPTKRDATTGVIGRRPGAKGSGRW